MDPSAMMPSSAGAGGHGAAFVDALVGGHPRLFAAALAVLVILAVVLMFEVNTYRSKCPAAAPKSSFYGGHHGHLGGESASGAGGLTHPRGAQTHQAIVGHRQFGGGPGANAHLLRQLHGAAPHHAMGYGAAPHHAMGYRAAPHHAMGYRREGLVGGAAGTESAAAAAAAAAKGPCAPGQTAVTYQDAGGATLVRCVDGGGLTLGACGAWNAEATAEAQALASVGGLEHDTYGEDALQSAIAD
jgi:hypothetical protein